MSDTPKELAERFLNDYVEPRTVLDADALAGLIEAALAEERQKREEAEETLRGERQMAYSCRLDLLRERNAERTAKEEADYDG